MRVPLDLSPAAILDGPAGDKLREVTELIFGRGPVWERLQSELQQNIREIFDVQEPSPEAAAADGG